MKSVDLYLISSFLSGTPFLFLLGLCDILLYNLDAEALFLFDGGSGIRSSSGGFYVMLDLSAKYDLLFFGELPRLNTCLFDDVEEPIRVDEHGFTKDASFTIHSEVLSEEIVTSMSTRSMMLNLWIDSTRHTSISSGSMASG